MLARKIRWAVLSAMIAACASLAAGCYVEAESPRVVYGYEPVYYDGYVVYYDDYGAPYYYVDGRVQYVPRTYVHYGALTRHYQAYRVPYHRWYTRDGYRYRTYRRR